MASIIRVLLLTAPTVALAYSTAAAGRASAGAIVVNRCRSPASPRMNLFADLQKGMNKVMAGPYDEAQVKAKVETMINRKPCVMFSLTTCPFCTQTKEILDGMGVMYTCLELDEEEDGMPMKVELSSFTGRTSLPAVFAGGTFLGGCNDGGAGGVATLQNSGELAPLLIKAGALSATQRI